MTAIAHPDLIYEYQQVLLGRAAYIPSAYFHQSTTVAGAEIINEQYAKEILKYAVEELLHWSPIQMRDRFSADVAKKLKLTRILTHIRLPAEVVSTDYFAYAAVLYPEIVPLRLKELTIYTYQRVLNKSIGKFPRGFFEDQRGQQRAAICLNYVLSQKCTFPSIVAVYEFFTHSDIKQILHDWHLETAFQYFGDTPLEFLHNSLAPEDRNDFLYHYFAFTNQLIGLGQKKRGVGKATAPMVGDLSESLQQVEHRDMTGEDLTKFQSL